MYVKEKVKNHFLNLLGDKELACAYFYDRDVVEEFNNDKLIELEKNVKNFKSRHDKFYYLYSLVKFLGIGSLSEKVTKNLSRTQELYFKSMDELDIFKSNLAYLIISGILKLENAQAMGYSKDFIKEFLVPYQKQADNPYNEYYYNENNGTTSMVTEKSSSLILPYTPHAILEKLKEKESRLYANAGVSSFKRTIRR